MIRHRGRGFTLLELLLAMAIGLLMVAGVLQVYQSSKSTYRQLEAAARVQENGRFALEFLTRDLREAGFIGCVSRRVADNAVSTLNTDLANDFLYRMWIPVEGFEAADLNVWVPDLTTNITLLAQDRSSVSNLTTLTSPPTSGTDVLAIRTARGNLPVTKHMNSVTADVQTIADSGIQVKDIALVSDCEAASVFQVTNTNAVGNGHNLVHNVGNNFPGNATTNLGKIYSTDAKIFIPRISSYFIAPGESGENALWRINNMVPLNDPLDGSYDPNVQDNPMELVEGVENLQVLFGEDLDNDENADVYRAANLVVDMAKVVSVRVSLLLRSFENHVVDGPMLYSYNGVNDIDPGDRRLWRVFTTTVGFRNRLP